MEVESGYKNETGPGWGEYSGGLNEKDIRIKFVR